MNSILEEMSMTEMFKRLGAPLANSRWSWGGVDEQGRVIMRVWEHQRSGAVGGFQLFKLLDENDARRCSSPGLNERKRHIDMVRNGALFGLLVVKAKDPDASVKKIVDMSDVMWVTPRDSDPLFRIHGHTYVVARPGPSLDALLFPRSAA